MMPFGAEGYRDYRAAGPRGRRGLLAAATASALLLAGSATAQEGAGVSFYTSPDFSGASKTLTLTPDQPYAAIPFVGDELNEKIRSLRADAGVGTILFQRPYFASRDDACGPNLGTAENPDAWWLGLTADFAPPIYGEEIYEAAELPDDDYSSVIAYRRDLGPPPGFLLMERRSYYNRGCERSADASYFNRLFVPIPNPPQREACVDLSTPGRAHGAGADAPGFTRVTEAVALYPESFDPRYGDIDHRFVLTVFDGPECSGQSITLPSQERGRPASYRLSDYEFDRRAQSVMIRYQRGPLDRYLESSTAPAGTAQVPQPATPTMEAPAAEAPAAEAPAAEAMSAPEPKPAPAMPRTSSEPESSGSSLQTQQSQAPESEAPGQSSGQAPAAAPLPPSGGLQPAPPTAPAQSQQQAPQPAPEPRSQPVQPAQEQAPSRPSGPQEETFRFPVHQVYRLNFCLEDEQGCGEPAANRWCEDQGFARASRWTREDNIGALYPTVFLGNGTICDKFLCDGFEEITCTR